MNLIILRHDFTDISAIGNLLIDGKIFCFTLEDKDRQRQPDGTIIPWKPELKIPGETAIPYGEYEVITNYSVRFKRVMPLLLHVPDFEGVRMHTGNTAEHTAGCILLGMANPQPDFVNQSVAAFGYFFPLLQTALGKGDKVNLSIRKGD
jgi:hypothetical protein